MPNPLKRLEVASDLINVNFMGQYYKHYEPSKEWVALFWKEVDINILSTNQQLLEKWPLIPISSGKLVSNKGLYLKIQISY